MRSERFETPGRLTIDAGLNAADLSVTSWEQEVTEIDVIGESEDEPTIAAEREVAIEYRAGVGGGDLVIREGKSSGRRWGLRLRDQGLVVRIRCPRTTELRVTGGSSDVHVDGVVRSLELKLGSGDAIVSGPILQRARITAASGDVSVDAVEGPLSVTTASGDVRIGRVAGELGANSVSGDVEVREAHGRATLQSVSGDVQLTALGGGDIRIQTVSGDASVDLARGAAAWVDAGSVSGEITSELDVGDDLPAGETSHAIELRVKTVSGDVRLGRAAVSV